MPTEPRSKGRTGRPWRRVRARVIRTETHCWICGQPVDKTLVWPDPMSATADHVDPLALGGAERQRGNLRLAHAGCNIRRGTRTPQPVITSRDW